jgi:hypothetical protein
MAKPKHPLYVHQRIHRKSRVKELVLTRDLVRTLQAKSPEYLWEQVKMFAPTTPLKDVVRMFPKAVMLVEKFYTGLTPLGRKRLAWFKKGARNPNAGGIPEERRLRIAASLKALDRRGVRNQFYGHKQTASAKKKISEAISKRNRGLKWAIDPEGKSRKVKKNFVLPAGWRWGRPSWRKSH